MDTGNQFERDPRSGTQQTEQAFRDDTGVASSQGQGEERLGKFIVHSSLFIFLFHCIVTGQINHVFLDNIGYSGMGGDQYAQQARYGQTGHGSAGHQCSDDCQGRAGVGRTSEPSSTSAQYGGSERSARVPTGGYSDPNTAGNWQGERDVDDTTGTTGGKPTVTSKVKGTSSSLWVCVGAR